MVISIGHNKNKEKLTKIVHSGSIGHAYLFIGKESIGKKIVAIEFAKNILCDSPKEGKNCGRCTSCLAFENSSDFKMISPVKDVIKVDTIREICNELFLMPTISSRKVFIIDDAHTMNEQAQNALLKVLEEPPVYATIILITSNKEKLLNTIKSRVIEIPFDSLTKEEIKTILEKQGKEVSKEALEFSNGAVKKTIEYIEDETFKIAKDLSESLLERDFLKINRKFEDIKADKNLKVNIPSILEKVMYIYYSKLKQDVTFDIKQIEALEKTIQNIKRNANVDLSLDAFMIDICKI